MAKLYTKVVDPSIRSLSDIAWYKNRDTATVDKEIFSIMDAADIPYEMGLTVEDFATGQWNGATIDLAVDQFTRNYIFAGTAKYDYKINDASVVQRLYYGGVISETPFVNGIRLPKFMPGFSAYNQGPVDLMQGNPAYQDYQNLMTYRVGQAANSITQNPWVYPGITLESIMTLSYAASVYDNMNQGGGKYYSLDTQWLVDIYRQYFWRK